MTHEDFGLTKEQAESVKDITPAFNLGSLQPGDTARFQVLDEKPRLVQSKDPDGKDKEDYVLTVENLDSGLKQTLWLSSMSLRREIFKVSEAKPLKEAKIVVGVRTYEHEKFGKTRAYVVQPYRGD